MSRGLSPFQIDALLRAIAADRLGLVPTEVAIANGVSRNALSRRRLAGALLPVFQGVHRLASAPATDLHRFLAATIVLPGAIVAGPSAAIIHGLPLPREFLVVSSKVVVAVPEDQRSRINEISAVRLQHPGSSIKWMTGRVSTPAATLVLLSRYLDAEPLERCLDHCLAARLVSVRGVLTELERWPAREVGRTVELRQMIRGRSDGAPNFRSKKEKRVAKWLRQAGLVGWQANHPVATGVGRSIEVDFAWTNKRVALEVSPFFTHGSRAKQARDAERRRQLTCAGWLCIEALDGHLRDERSFSPILADLINLLR